jgi:hypothetical protein
VTLFVCSWLWGEKWPSVYAERLFAGVGRNLRQEFRSVLITDQVGYAAADIVCQIDAADRPLLAPPGCLVRMRMFDPAWQEKIGAKKGDRIVCIDVDAVITGLLDPLFDRDDEFTIMQGFNQTNPCPLNGSLWLFRAGERHDVWTDFGIDAHRKYEVPVHSIADDQGWLHFKFPSAKAYTPRDGVYAFKKIGWGAAGRRGLPDNARIVAFPGRDPGKYPELSWVRQHWLGAAAC